MCLGKEFAEIIQRMNTSSHGSKSWREAAQFFQDRFKKSKKRLAFLTDRILRPPIYWENVREALWPRDVQKQNQNQSPFLQGDILRTALVQSWISSIGEQRTENSLWMVLSPDCDAVRREFVRVRTCLRSR